MNTSVVSIIYASTSGNVELVVETISQLLNDKGIKTLLHRAEMTKIDEIKNNKQFIFATSTWEHGRINPFFDKLLSEINKLPDNSLAGKTAGFVGLGDKRYEPVLFCHGIEVLKGALINKGIEQVGETLKLNGEPHGLLGSVVKPWAEQFANVTKAQTNK